MIIPGFTLSLLIVSAVLCCMGFKKFVWFMSIGYGLSTCGLGIVLLIIALMQGDCSVLYAIQCILMAVYGFRLGGFLFLREMRNAGYKKRMDEVAGAANKKVPFFVSLFMWVYCSVIYLCQSACAIYRLGNGKAGQVDACLVIGVIISALGIVIEAVADKQKSAQKKLHPDLPAMTGLFKISRCPNYFGEILNWTGIFVSGLSILQGWQWVIAILGYLEIVYVMISGAQRLEKRHLKNYATSVAFQAYAKKTPILVPFLPIYSLVKAKTEEKEEK